MPVEIKRNLSRGSSLRWQWKAIIPIVGGLLLGLLAFKAIVLALNIPSGNWILIVAAAGAVTICFVTLNLSSGSGATQSQVRQTVKLRKKNAPDN